MTIEPASDELVAEIERGLDGVTPGPWEARSEQVYGDRSSFVQYEIWDDDYNILIGTEVRRGHGDGGVENMLHIARCSPDNIGALISRIRKEQEDASKAAAMAAAFAESSSTIISDMEAEITRLKAEVRELERVLERGANAILYRYGSK